MGFLSSLLGGGGKSVAQPTSGYGTLPKEVQSFLLDSYFPRVEQVFNAPYQSVPTKRASIEGEAGFDPIFSSYALSDWQKASDAAGGYFSPLSTAQKAAPAAAAPAAPAASSMGQIAKDMFSSSPLAKDSNAMTVFYAKQNDPAFWDNYARTGDFYGSAGGKAFFSSPEAKQELNNHGHARLGRPLMEYAPYDGGVTGFYEPLHQFSKLALSQLGNAPTQGFQQGANSLAALGTNLAGVAPAQYYGNAANSLANLGQGFDYNAALQNYSNPYQGQVVNSAVSAINDSAAEMRNRINSKNPGARSFGGNSAQAFQLSQLGQNQMRTIGDTVGNLNMQGYNQALSTGLQAYGQQQQGYGQQASGYAGLGSSLAGQQQSVFGGLADLGTRNLASQLGAGEYITNFNQGLADKVGANYAGLTGYPANSLANLGSYLNPFQQNVGYTQKPSSGQGLLGLAVAGAGAYFGGPAGAAAASGAMRGGGVDAYGMGI